MKKILLTVSLLSVAAFVVAQDTPMMSKKGTPILPEAGDWSIGVDAVPFIDWAFDKTRIMSNQTTTGSSGAISPQSNMTLVGLYVKDAETAYRVMFRLGFGSTSMDAFSVQTGTITNPPAMVTDTWETSDMGITIGGGIQKSRGKGRLHGIYGAQAMIGLTSSSHTFSYGNPLVATTAGIPASTDFGTSANNIQGSVRITENSDGSTFAIGLGGFIGVEYFFAPKMSFSAEYGWGLNLNSTGEGEITAETSDGIAIQSSTTKTGGDSSFSLDVMNINSASTGNIVFHFYF
jgi:hypothetical protein